MSQSPLARIARALAQWAAPSFSHSAPGAGRAPSVRSDPSSGYYDPAPGLSQVLQHSCESLLYGVKRQQTLLAPLLPGPLAGVPLAEEPIELIHFRPAASHIGPLPLVLMSPILGNSLLLVDRFATALARRGIHAVVVQRKDLAFHPDTSVRLAEEEVRLLVIRSRQALDYLAGLPEVDPGRLGSFGVSAGGIVSSMIAGADPRLRAHVWMLAGGPLPDVMLDTVEAEYRGYAQAVLRQTPRTRNELRRELREVLRTDPIRLAATIDPHGVLMVLARFDRSVPYRYGLRLWEAMGRPERITSPLGHYSTFLLLPWLEERTVAHFVRHLGSGTRG